MSTREFRRWRTWSPWVCPGCPGGFSKTLYIIVIFSLYNISNVSIPRKIIDAIVIIEIDRQNSEYFLGSPNLGSYK